MKNKLSIKEKQQIKKEKVTVAIDSTAAAAVLMVAVGATNCVMSCNDRNKAHTAYNINYGDIKVSGEDFENINKQNVMVILTPYDEKLIAIRDSKDNYYIVRDNKWYVIYLIDRATVSLISEDGTLVSGKIIKFNAFLNSEKNKQKYFTLDELLNIENKLNKEKTLALTNVRG